jgi:hypothetical protein
MIPHFKPHKLSDLVERARTTFKDNDPAVALVLAFRAANDAQLRKIVRALGLDFSDQLVWQKAFFALANIYCGVAHITHRRKATNRNAQTCLGPANGSLA